jgi:hypothetical protein
VKEGRTRKMNGKIKPGVNLISIDNQTAMDSFGDIYKVGDRVGHYDQEGGVATILYFVLDRRTNEVIVVTNRGRSVLDSVFKAV